MSSDPRTPATSSSWRLDLALIGLLALATVLVYAQVAGHGFVFYDDDDYVARNRHVQAGLSLAGLRWAATSGFASNWHPLTWLSHMLDCQLFGLDPGRHHLSSVALHVANTLLLFLALRWMTGSSWRSAFVAGVFALHPLHVESVAWASERKDVLSAFFWMLALLAYAWYARRPSIGRYVLVAACTALGLTAKPMVVTLPFVLLLLDLWPLRRWRPGAPGTPSLGRLALEKLPLIALAILSSVVTLVVQQGAMASPDHLPFGLRLQNAIVAYGTYVAKTVWPAGLAVFYPHPHGAGPGWKIAGSMLLLAALTWHALRSARTRPHVLVGWLWFLGTLVPVIGLVQVGDQAYADRYTYVPMIGLAILLAWSVPDPGTTRRIAVASSAFVVLVALALLSARQVSYWKDNTSLFRHTLAVTERNHLAHFILGYGYAAEKQEAAAAEQYQEALRIKPNFPEAHNALGRILEDRGLIDEAIAHYREVVRWKPRLPAGHHNLGSALDTLGHLEEAQRSYREAIRLEPEFYEAHNGLGVTFAKQGDFANAILSFRRALEIDPGYVNARLNLGAALLVTEDDAGAALELAEVLRADPENVEARQQLDLARSRLAAPKAQ